MTRRIALIVLALVLMAGTGWADYQSSRTEYWKGVAAHSRSNNYETGAKDGFVAGLRGWPPLCETEDPVFSSEPYKSLRKGYVDGYRKGQELSPWRSK